MGLNVLDVEHHRSGLILGLNEVEVLITMEARDPEHRDAILTDLQGAGYQVQQVR
jgi:threonine dehydratase